ncbi:hypothetical protein [Candidatus Berkiella aquae]|uniref:Uncharacterized protein n=1 Tax=Candidatus Berkiella aquae TaxID=295108 RepID=A0A0Q9YM50_9GAMM|nr:hypothetical protein [Candidatus Berkiella aquae]MCS5711382.1 hypothetical protein [Candidatus Berkiella aquae]
MKCDPIQTNSSAECLRSSVKNELLLEVNQGCYQNFRAYLTQNKITHLEISGSQTAIPYFDNAKESQKIVIHKDAVHWSHLSLALKGLPIILVEVSNMRLNNKDVDDLAKICEGIPIISLSLKHCGIKMSMEILSIKLENAYIAQLSIYPSVKLWCTA